MLLINKKYRIPMQRVQFFRSYTQLFFCCGHSELTATFSLFNSRVPELVLFVILVISVAAFLLISN